MGFPNRVLVANVFVLFSDVFLGESSHETPDDVVRIKPHRQLADNSEQHLVGNVSHDRFSCVMIRGEQDVNDVGFLRSNEVGVGRFELPTFWSQTRRANQTALHPEEIYSVAGLSQAPRHCRIAPKRRPT